MRHKPNGDPPTAMRTVPPTCRVAKGVYALPWLLATLLLSLPVRAETPSSDPDYAQVKFVQATRDNDGSWCISTRVRHHDQGWNHYADGWRVVDEQENQLGWRLLAHPHVHEQPFTRDLCGINIPPGVKHIRVEAKCNLHGYGGQAVTVDLSAGEGKDFRVIDLEK